MGSERLFVPRSPDADEAAAAEAARSTRLARAASRGTRRNWRLLQGLAERTSGRRALNGIVGRPPRR